MTPPKRDELSIRHLFVDAIVRHKMEQQQIEIDEDWLDIDTDLILWDRLPGHLQGPVAQMRENSLPLADHLYGIVHGRLW